MKKTISLLLTLSLLIGLMVFSVVATAQDNDTVHIAIQTEPSKLNPITYQDTETDFVLSQICDPLVEVSTEGSYTAEGAIIEDYRIEEDGKVYVFEIREGIKFHNGENLTGEDVKFTYESLKDKELASPHRSYYEGIEDIVLVDEYTVKVILGDTNVTFLTNARLRNHVLPKDYIEEVGWDGYEKHPIGSGPYEFIEQDPGQRIVLKKFEDFWGENAKIDNLIFRFYPETTSAVMALQTKEIDFIAEMPAEVFEDLKSKEDVGLKFGTYNKFEDHRVCFNKRKDSIFSDVRLRKAVAYAINRYELIELTRGDMAVPAAGRVPSFHPATAPKANAYEENLKKAQELMAEAGYPDGFKTKIFAPSGYRERVLEVQQIQQQLARINIDLEVVTLEWGTYLDVTADGQAPMFRERWSAGVPSPYSFVENWHSESGWNAIFGTYKNDEVDALIDLIKVTTDQEERWQLYRTVQNLAMDEVACYPLYWPVIGEAYNDEITIPEDVWNVFKRPIYNVDKWHF